MGVVVGEAVGVVVGGALGGAGLVFGTTDVVGVSTATATRLGGTL